MVCSFLFQLCFFLVCLLISRQCFIPDIVTGCLHLLEYASVCRPRSHFQVYGKQLTKNVKVFPEWNEDRYYIGQTGDFLVVDAYDLHHIYVERAQDFKDNYLEDY